MRATQVSLFLVLVACHHDGWHVSMPEQITAVPMDSVYSFQVQNVTGGVKPGPVQNLEAHCADPAICEARAKPGVVDVIPKSPGSTTILVEVKDAYDKHTKHSVAVTITPATEHEPFALGALLPASSDLVYRVGETDVAHCTPTTAQPSSVAGAERPDVHVFDCSSFIELGNQRRFRNDDHHLLCTQVKDNHVVGTATIESVDGKNEVKATEGTLDTDVCTARN